MSHLKECDLLFVVKEGGNNITKVTAHNGEPVDHVAIFHRIGGQGGAEFVIEAYPRGGVMLTPLRDFLDRAGMKVIVARVSTGIDIEKSVARALSHVGKPYDNNFGNGTDSIYCSELVQISLVDSCNNHVFSTIPMSFRDSAGNIPAFWLEYYSQQGLPVPEGEPGSNPASLLNDDRMLIVEDLRLIR